MNENETSPQLGVQKALARETVQAVADIFALKLMLASSGRAEDDLATELERLRQTALYKIVVKTGESKIDRAEQSQQLLDLLVKMRNAA